MTIEDEVRDAYNEVVRAIAAAIRRGDELGPKLPETGFLGAVRKELSKLLTPQTVLVYVGYANAYLDATPGMMQWLDLAADHYLADYGKTVFEAGITVSQMIESRNLGSHPRGFKVP